LSVGRLMAVGRYAAMCTLSTEGKVRNPGIAAFSIIGGAARPIPPSSRRPHTRS
jgi:hypothetical protein